MLLTNWLKEFTDKFILSLWSLLICLILFILVIAGIIWIVKNPDKFMRFLNHFLK